MWRWHFYASFLVIPVLALLAVTGLIYLLRFQLEPALHPGLMHLEPRPGVGAATYDDQREAVEQALDAVTTSSTPTGWRSSARSTPTPRCRGGRCCCTAS